MVLIILSERDFDYELQALVTGFFPGQAVKVIVHGEENSAGEPGITLDIILGQFKIYADARTSLYKINYELDVTGSGNWHKHIDKAAHPYRTYYKNVLKKLVFCLLRDFPADMLPDGITKRIPAWGTMTGVRPVKIVMDQVLGGIGLQEIKKSLEDIYCLDPVKAELAMQIAVREAKLLANVDYENGYSLYIGIPFCPTTCSYCSFTSYPFDRYGSLADAYLDALEKEMEYSSHIFSDRKLTSIYIGGGTPTSLSAIQLGRLLKSLCKYFPVGNGIEFTVEAGRPDSITEEKLKVIYGYGARRISVNPQTMQQKTLDIIGRKHTAIQTVDAFNLARKTGFSNINMDLIIGLPGEKEEDFAGTLSKIKDLSPDSLTIHSLVVKRASRLRDTDGGYGTAETCKSLCMENMLDMGQEFARCNGYLPYYMYRQKNSCGHAGSTGQENIGYAREGKECLYNILIMEEKQTILALGAGASTKLYHACRKQVERIENVKSVDDYIRRIGEMIGRKKSIYGRLYKEDSGK